MEPQNKNTNSAPNVVPTGNESDQIQPQSPISPQPQPQPQPLPSPNTFMGQTTPAKAPKSNSKLIIVIVVVLLIVAAIVGYFFVRKSSTQKSSSPVVSDNIPKTEAKTTLDEKAKVPTSTTPATVPSVGLRKHVSAFLLPYLPITI